MLRIPLRTGALAATLAALACVAPRAPERSSDPTADAYLTGFARAVVEHDLGWEADAFSLVVEDRVARIAVSADLQPDEDGLRALLLGVEGIEEVEVSVGDPAEAADQSDLPDFADGLEEGEGQLLPEGDYFAPLIADPKQPQFSMSLREYDTRESGSVTVAAVAYGETFGLYRHPFGEPGDGVQIGLAGALFAQFNADSSSFDLINADYTVGVPVTLRRGRWSMRARLYHQSSHLGDEILLGPDPPRRQNLSFESVELLGSADLGAFRAYAGGEYLVHRQPQDLDPAGLHAGLEVRGAERILGLGRPLAGVDVKCWEEHDWDPDVSIKAGVELGEPNPGQRRLRLLVEAYDGFSPHGQFYDQEIRYLGFGVYFGF